MADTPSAGGQSKKVKVKLAREQAMKAQNIQLYSFLNLGVKRGWFTSSFGDFTPEKETRNPLYRGLGGS
jgi:hypothetical protein